MPSNPRHTTPFAPLDSRAKRPELAATPAALCGHAGNTATPAPLLVDTKTLATMLGIGVRTLWRLVSQGKLPRPLTLGKKLRRWRLDKIREWTAAGCPPRGDWDARDGRQGGRR